MTRATIKRVRLGEVATINYGTRIRSKDSTSDNYPVYGGGGKTFGWVDYNRENQCVVSRFAMSEECVRFVSGKFFLNDSGLTVEANATHLQQEYLNWFLLGHQHEIYALGRGCAQKNLRVDSFLELELSLPPLPEQKRIAEALDKISEMKRNAEARLQKLDLLVKARFNEMFGTVADGKFPRVKLDDICEFIKDGTHQTPTYTEDSERGYKFLSSKDVTSGRIDWSHIKYIPPELHEELYKRIAPRRGDILLAKNGTTGIAALVDNDEVFDIYVSLALLRFKQGNDPRYLLAAINSSDTRRQFNSSLKGIGVPNLHLGEIKKAQIPLPPFMLQEEFAAFVEKVEAQKAIAQKELEKVDLLYRAKLQEYFG